jgi:transposase
LTTKIHALVDALGNPANLMLTPGQTHDLARAQTLIENADPNALIGDKAYDADSLINTLAQREITPVIAAVQLVSAIILLNCSNACFARATLARIWAAVLVQT